jgi:phosphohistidine phosphatase SixA
MTRTPPQASIRTRSWIKAAALTSVALALLFVPALASGSSPSRATEKTQPVTVFLLRHAEKLVTDDPDPLLSEAGETRSQQFARLVSRAGVTHLFASQFRRTQDTLAPLGAALELETQVVPTQSPDELVERLRGLPPGAIAVVAGHSNTIPQLVALLGGKARDLVEHPTYGMILPDACYDRLYVVTLPKAPDAQTQTLELLFGG